MEITKTKLKKSAHLHYSNRECRKLMRKQAMTTKESILYAMIIEEIAELLEVCIDSIGSKPDYLHIVEEVVDVEICITTLIMLCESHGMKNISKDIKKPGKRKKSSLIESMNRLTNAQMGITKILRGKATLQEKGCKTIVNMREAVLYIKHLYKIKPSDMETIMNMKMERLEGRLKNGTAC